MPEILSGQMLLKKKKKHDFNKQRGKEQYAFKIFDLVSLIKQGLLKSKILKAKHRVNASHVREHPAKIFVRITF